MRDHLSRRSFLVAVAETLGIAAAGFSWTDIVKAAHEAHVAAEHPAASSMIFLTDPDAADVAAIADRIIPSDGTAGASEAGVVYFIDRALAGVFSRLAVEFRTQLAEFQAACLARNPDVPCFAALSADRQIAFLSTVDHTPFFDRMRWLTLLGMFSMPAYGGNLGGVGWKLIGFEDRHVFAPPFGYYDRDYPGFASDPAKAR